MKQDASKKYKGNTFAIRFKLFTSKEKCGAEKTV